MRLFVAAAASLAFTLGVTALLLGLAGLAGDSARVWMLSWQESGNVGNWAQWETAFGRLQQARRLNPLNADYSADLGQLMEWHSWQRSLGIGESAASRALAEEFYLEAISRRPSWGFAWAHYAENRLLQGRSGKEFQIALEKAIELSPWEPGVQRKVAWMGMAAWDLLPTVLRERVRQNIERAVQLDIYRYEIVRLAVQYDWLQHLKPMMRSERQVATLEFVLDQIDQR
jgi:hypothetical protein